MKHYRFKELLRKIAALYEGTEVDWRDCWMYTIITLLAHPLMHIVAFLYQAVVNGWEESAPEFHAYYLSHFWIRLPSLFFLYVVVVHVLVTLMFHKMPATHYRENASPSLWWKSGLLLMLPGETVRFFVSVLPNLRIPFINAEFMNTAFGNTFANAANVLFARLYLIPFVTPGRAYHFGDYLVYALFHIVYLAGYLAVQLFLYKWFWDKEKNKSEETRTTETSRSASSEYDRPESYRMTAVREMLRNAAILCAGMTIIGTVSNVFLMLLGWVATLPAFEMGLANVPDRPLWFFFAAFSIIFCMTTLFPIAKHVGSQAAQFRIGYQLPRKVSLLSMSGCILTAAAVHGILCLIFAWSYPSDCFVAGPVQYIARFLADAERAMFISDSFDFPRFYTYLAIGLYLLFLILVSVAGYLAGHRKQFTTICENPEIP